MTDSMPTVMGTPEIKIDHRVAYNMAEFEALKSEIGSLVDQTTTNLTYAIAVSGGVLAWLLTHSVPPKLFVVATGIPFVVAALFAAYTGACYLRIGVKADYLAEIEQMLSLPGLGWEGRFQKRHALIGAVNFAIWLVLLAASAAVWVFLAYSGGGG